MRCQAAESLVSRLMDEEGLRPSDLDAHLAACAPCRTFGESALRIREVVRLDVAPPVPDLRTRIMERVRDDVAAERGRGPSHGHGSRSGRRGTARIAMVGLVAGIALGLLLATGGILPLSRTVPTARAGDVPLRLRSAAASLGAYRAVFRISEANWTRAVPSRTFRAEVDFRAPESLRVRVTDLSRYPSGAWPRNDLFLVTDGRAWRVVGPDPCPRAALPACPTGGSEARTVVGRAPFDAQTSMPTDVIVPMTVLAASDRATLAGAGRVDGRDAIAVAMAYQDARPLFDFLTFLGSWRPFYPQDRVLLWLDRSTWFPLRWEVYPDSGAERASWAAQMGLPPEPPGRAVFSATARSLSTTAPPAALFAVPRDGDRTDRGFRDLPLPGPSRALLTPGDAQGLRAWRAGRLLETALRPYGQTELAFARGLSWLTVIRVTGWRQKAAFGIGPFAERSALPGGGLGYYEPADGIEPRRIALHTARGEFLVATNLDRRRLMRAAGTLPVCGMPLPRTWLVHRGAGQTVQDGLDPAQALGRVDFPALVPGFLPDGYRAAAAEVVASRRNRGVTIAYRRPAAELDGIGLRWYQASGQLLGPPRGVGQTALELRGTVARWSADEHLLEWVEDGVYRSLSGPSFDLATMVRIAASMHRWEGGG